MKKKVLEVFWNDDLEITSFKWVDNDLDLISKLDICSDTREEMESVMNNKFNKLMAFIKKGDKR